MVDQNPETVVATPGSPADSGCPAKTPNSGLIPKDRNCPFCHQQFTSSSLGRHLDLYIKERNPKPPDDVHDVNEIRKLRGSVTRRQARTSSTKREGSVISSSKPTPLRDQRSPSATSLYPNINQSRVGLFRTTFNKPNWHQTGVINDLPPLTRDEPQSPNKRRRTSIKEEIPRRDDALEERDRRRAAELALREVLDSVRAANLRAHPRPPFDFNWFSQSFPAICLRCLSVPLRLFSAPSNPRDAAWSLKPPRHDQYRDLEAWLQSKLREWKQQRVAAEAHQPHETNGVNGHSFQHRPPQEMPEEETAYYKHLSTVFQAWEILSEEQKHENWRFECQQAFAREKEKRREMEAKLDRAEQENYHLRAQLAQLSDSQRPTEFARFPPSTMPLSRETLQALSESNDLSEWNYETTILKWKGRIQNQRSQSQSFLQPPLNSAWPPSLLHSGSPLSGTSSHIQPHRHDQNPHHQITTQSPEHDPSDEDEDLADALGDDDVELHQTNHMPPSDAKLDRSRDHLYGTMNKDLRGVNTLARGTDSESSFNVGAGERRMGMVGSRQYEPLIHGNNGNSVLS